MKRICIQIRRDFLPLIRFLKSAEISRGKQNVFDEPLISNFTRYAMSRGEIFSMGKNYQKVASEMRKCLLEMITKALKIEMNYVSEFDFDMEPRDPRLCIMKLGLEDKTRITVPLIDKSATREE